VRPELAIGARVVAGAAHLGGHVEHHGHGEHVVAAGQLDQRPAVLGTDVGGVHHGDPAGLEALGGDGVQHLERGGGGALVVLVVGDEAAADVRGDDLGRDEVAGGEARLSRAGQADERDQAQLGEAHGRVGAAHRRNTAICVGEPRVPSSGPMPVRMTR
jgi:hypothetical protein